MKYIQIYILMPAILLLAGCGESFLELDNPAALTYDKFYKTEADFRAALDGCYFRLQSQVPYLLIFNESTTDNTYLHRDNNTYQQYQFDNLTVAGSSAPVQNFWRDCYQAIMYTNMVITRIFGSQVPDAARKVIVSEARFIRALTYFNMVRIYGGVPLYSEEISNLNAVYETKRSSVDEVYDFIISDLIAAQNIDSERSEQQNASAKGRATSAAVKALLGKVYLHRHDYANAVTTLTDVIENSGYTLIDLDDLYNPDTPVNDEVIFAINYERVGGQNNPFAYNFLPKYSRGILPDITSGDNGDGVYNLEDNIVAGFDKTNDKRFALIDSAETLSGADLIKFYYTKKYLDEGAVVGTGTPYYSASDFIFLRFADVLLMCADAVNQSDNTAGAYPYINAVRTRAGLGDLPGGLTKSQMNDALAAERQKEFIGEADRWFDLSFRGFDYLKTTLNNFFPTSHTPLSTVKDHMNIFPIPADQVNLKPEVLEPNPGY